MSTTGASTRSGGRTAVTVVHSPACHFCDDAERTLDALAREHPIDVTLVGIDTPEGRDLVARHRPALNPLVLVDGQFFSQGRLPRKKLVALLRTRARSAGSDAGAPAVAGV